MASRKKIFSQKQKFGASALVSIFLVGVAAFSYVYLVGVVKNGRASLKEVEVRIADLEEERRQSSVAKRKLQEAGVHLDRVSGFFTDRERPIAFIEYLEELERQTKNAIALDIIPEANGPKTSLPFRLTVEGTEKSIAKYLELLELVPYEVRIEDISYQRFSGADASLLADKSRTRGITPTSRIALLIRVKTK